MEQATTKALQRIARRDGMAVLAGRIGVSDTTLSRWLTGITSPQSDAVRQAIVRVIQDEARAATKEAT